MNYKITGNYSRIKFDIPTFRGHIELSDWEKIVRDIREDLKERLEHIRQQITVFQAREKSLMNLISVEEADFGGGQENLFAQQTEGDNPIRQFIINALGDGSTVWSVDDLKDRADDLGFEIPSQHPGRSLNINLVNMLRSGMVAKDGDGDWYLVTHGKKAEEPDSKSEDDIPF